MWLTTEEFAKMADLPKEDVVLNLKLHGIPYIVVEGKIFVDDYDAELFLETQKAEERGE